ncbi:hypothetical protein SDJN02_15985, partial [Cucurbita argyrosperma subsp. argyrosperma]
MIFNELTDGTEPPNLDTVLGFRPIDEVGSSVGRPDLGFRPIDEDGSSVGRPDLGFRPIDEAESNEATSICAPLPSSVLSSPTVFNQSRQTNQIKIRLPYPLAIASLLGPFVRSVNLEEIELVHLLFHCGTSSDEIVMDLIVSEELATDLNERWSLSFDAKSKMLLWNRTSKLLLRMSS